MNGKLIGVLGNKDDEKFGLLKNFQDIGGELHGEFCDLQLDNLKIATYHGTSNKMTEAYYLKSTLRFSHSRAHA